jgi:SulP family sulfate permease
LKRDLYEVSQPNDDHFENQNQDKLTFGKMKQLFSENIYPGITVALVSLPLSCALTMASGGTAMMGLTTAIYGPGIGGVLGGSNYNILGPAGALVNIISTLKAVNGVAIIPFVALVSGIMSFIVYLLKLEGYCTMIPTSVLEGFSLGVACSIGLGQLNYAFGLCNLAHHKHFYMNVEESIVHVGQLQYKEFLPFLVFFVALMYLLKYKPQIPWIIVVAFVGIIYGVIMKEVVGNKDIQPLLLMDLYPQMRNGL